ncbi:hypothetical protein PR002_g18150 [Phytophthora rubi]|uniref:Uncharacterized protein n=1 Tax=Phytophthora rubi TaxID=129364 RepID=A0A6A3K0A7_9STRA|nr:hypothetical protein PR002_g18150 [Phytophthora rubi]
MKWKSFLTAQSLVCTATKWIPCVQLCRIYVRWPCTLGNHLRATTDLAQFRFSTSTSNQKTF